MVKTYAETEFHSPSVHAQNYIFKEDCWNLSDSSFIGVEKQKPFGSNPKKGRKKENEAEIESPVKKPEWKDTSWCLYTDEWELGEKEKGSEGAPTFITR